MTRLSDPHGHLPSALVVTDSDLAERQIVSGLDGFATVLVLRRPQLAEVDFCLRSETPIVLVFAGPPSHFDLFEALQKIASQHSVPAVVFVDQSDAKEAKRAVRAGASAYIVDGLSPGRILPIVEVAIERFRLIDTLQRELQKSKDDLAARKTIERAKGLLMERRGLSEQDAYDALRKAAMGQGKSIREVAETILSISSLLP